MQGNYNHDVDDDEIGERTSEREWKNSLLSHTDSIIPPHCMHTNHLYVKLVKCWEREHVCTWRRERKNVNERAVFKDFLSCHSDFDVSRIVRCTMQSSQTAVRAGFVQAVHPSLWMVSQFIVNCSYLRTGESLFNSRQLIKWFEFHDKIDINRFEWKFKVFLMNFRQLFNKYELFAANLSGIFSEVLSYQCFCICDRVISSHTHFRWV